MEGTRRWGFIAALHLFAVAALLPVFALVGERSAWVALLLYLPRALFALPLLVTVPVLLWRGARRLLVLPAATAALVFGPLMGLHLRLPGGRPEAPRVRLLTYNVWFGARDPQAIAAEIAAADPDIVLFQATSHRVDDPALKVPRFAQFHYLREAAFTVSSRYPVRLVSVPKELGTASGPPFVHLAIDSPLGTLDVFSAHPTSLRGLFGQVRDGGLRRLFAGELEIPKAATPEFLTQQLALLGSEAARTGPLTLVAGDFNVPEGGVLMRELFPAFADAFAEAGNGYGYTFPANGRLPIPWLRLDRILLGGGLAAVRAEVAGIRGSDHAALVVDFVAR